MRRRRRTKTAGRCPDWWARLTDQLAKWRHCQVEDGTLCWPIRSLDRLGRHLHRCTDAQIPVAVSPPSRGPQGLGYNDNITQQQRKYVRVSIFVAPPVIAPLVVDSCPKRLQQCDFN